MTILLALLLVAPPDIAVTRWVSPDNSRPLSFREWRSRLPAAAGWNVRLVRAAGSFSERTDVLVEESLYTDLAQSLDTLAADLVRESTSVAIYAVSGTSAESLRAFLADEYAAGVRAAVFVGDLPIAWFQMIDDWNSNGVRDPDEGYEEFPCDYFFSDIDGIWHDVMVQLDTLDSLVLGTDSIYDYHSGHIQPELAISRLPASAVGHEVQLLQTYFLRNHNYRSGLLPLPDRALVYIDDDWADAANEWSGDVGYLYHDRLLVADPETTRCADYRPRLDTCAFQWIQLCAHSWPGGHGMKFNQGNTWDWFWADEIRDLNPATSFYNLFACSNARYVEPGFCGGCYVFQTSTGLGATGSTKTGSMLNFSTFYYPLSTGSTVAAALREWFYWQMYDQWENWEKSWYMGMCWIGDGTLKPRLPQTALTDESAIYGLQSTISVAPNPVRSGSAVRLLTPHSSVLTPHSSVSVFSSTGRLILTLPCLPSAVFRLPVLPAGAYFLRLGPAFCRLTVLP